MLWSCFRLTLPLTAKEIVFVTYICGACVANGIAFIPTATCKNKGRNSPFTPGIVFCSQSLSHVSKNAATPATPLCLLREIGVNSTPWGKRFYYEFVKRFPTPPWLIPCSHFQVLVLGTGRWERSTLWMFPGVFQGTSSWANIRHRGLQRPAPLFLGSSQGQEGDDNAHFCLRYLKHCPRHHLQFSPYTSALDMKKYSF